MKHVVAILALLVVIITTSCATPGIKPLESGLRTQSAEPIFLDHGGRTVCVYFGDNSGHNLDLRTQIEAKLAAKGFQVVASENQADYVVDARLTYLGYAKDYPDQPALGRILGTTTGAVGGGLIGRNNGGGTGALIGGSVGGLVGLLVGQAIDKANTPDLYVGELHLLVRERLTFLADQPDARPIVHTRKKTVTRTVGGKTQVTQVAEMEEASDSPEETDVATRQSGRGNSRTTTQHKVADWSDHQTSMYGVAKVVRTDTTTAIAALSGYFTDGVAGVF